MTRAAACLLFLALVAVPCFAYQSQEKKVVFFRDGRPGPCEFKVEVVSTPDEQARGLMFRERLDPDSGMLFVFKKDEMRYFWMRNTLIPLDMIFLDSGLRVVHVHRWAAPGDETSISSQSAARYVLEINGGQAAECRIERGTKARFINLSP